MDRHDSTLLLFALGVLLVLNPVFLFPYGTPYVDSVTYGAEPVGDGADRVLEERNTVLDCSDGIRSFECLQAHRIGYNGTLTVQAGANVVVDASEWGPSETFDFVRFAEGYARPNVTVANGSAQVSLRPVPERRVLDHFAYPYDELPAIGQQAVRTGEALTTRYVFDYDDVSEPITDRQRLVARNGTYYRLSVQQASSRPAIPGPLLDLLAVAGVVVGLGLILYARSKLPDQADE